MNGHVVEQRWKTLTSAMEDELSIGRVGAFVTVRPHELALQFHGWEVVLRDDGSWLVGDTSGG